MGKMRSTYLNSKITITTKNKMETNHQFPDALRKKNNGEKKFTLVINNSGEKLESGITQEFVARRNDQLRLPFTKTGKTKTGTT